MYPKVDNIIPPLYPAETAPPQVAETDQKVAALMQEIISKKEEHVTASLKNRVNPSEIVQVGGDLFSMGYLLFQGAQIVKPSLSSIPFIATASLVCGVVAGAINIGVAFVCLKEGIQAHKNGDMQLAARLYIDFVALLGIGMIMIFTALATRVAALGAIGGFFAANPWLLPILFFALSVPLFFELGKRINNIIQSKDLASQLNAKNLPALIQGKDPSNPFHLQPLLHLAEKSESDPRELKIALSHKMEQLQSDMGVESAIETFKLMQQLVLKKDIEAQLKKVKEKIQDWNRAQYVRAFQQLLYTAAFGVSMAALSPKVNIPPVTATQTFAMAGANAIPLYMDSFWPFKRNTPIVVPKVEAS